MISGGGGSEGARMNNEAHFHWSEGNKFALEALKSIFILNSSIAAALIAFTATTKAFLWCFVAAACIFFVAAILAVVLLTMGYYVNLRQGNSYNRPPDKKRNV